MSFVAIIEEKNPIELHNKVYEASKNGELTPEVCMDILSQTNVSVIIGKMLEEIEKLPIEEQGQYNEVILSMFDYRQTSKKVKDKALEMSKNNGFESELNDVIERTGEWGYSAKFGVKDEVYVIDRPGYYRDVDFSSYNGVVVKGDIKDFSLFENNTLRGRVDLRGVESITFNSCNLQNANLIFGEGIRVNWLYCNNINKNTDFSECGGVYLRCCDVDGIDLKFKEGAMVSLIDLEKMSGKIDVSMCDYVSFEDSVLPITTDFSKVDEIKFKNREQYYKSGIFGKIKERKIVFADEEENVKKISLFDKIISWGKNK